MRFLVDECTGPAVAAWLRDQGHDVFSVYELARGTDDDSILQRAVAEYRIIVTNDKDFGEKIYRERQTHHGVILLRLDDERSAHKITILHRLLEQYIDQLVDHFVVVTDTGVRFARFPSDE